jgi:hypothetical protein
MKLLSERPTTGGKHMELDFPDNAIVVGLAYWADYISYQLCGKSRAAVEKAAKRQRREEDKRFVKEFPDEQLSYLPDITDLPKSLPWLHNR